MRPFGPRHLLVTVCKFVVLVCCLCAACSLGAGVGGGFCHVRSIDEGRGAGGDGCQAVIVFFMYSDHQAEEAHADLYAGHGRLIGRWREWTGAG